MSKNNRVNEPLAPEQDDPFKDFETSGNVRDGTGYNERLNFRHIYEDPENKEKFDFVIENDARGAIQQRESLGWRVWEGEAYGMINSCSWVEISGFALVVIGS